MNTRIQLGLKLAALLALSLTLCSQAFADRRTSLMGNMLLTDRDDSFIYPQEMLKYNNSLSLDYGPSIDAGNALLIAGPNKSMAIGIALSRGDIMSPITMGGAAGSAVGELLSLGSATSPSEALVNNVYREPKTVADLMYARKLGGGRLGLRVGITGALSTVDPDGDDGVSGQNQFGLRLSAGYTVSKLGNFVLDFVTETSENLADNKATERAEAMMVHVGARLYPVRQKNFKLGVLADVSYMAGSDTQLSVDKDPANEFSALGVMLGAGPVYTSDSKKLKVAFQAMLGYNSTSSDPNNSDDVDPDTTSSVLFPGFNVSMEYMLRDWLALRTGAISYYSFDSTGNDAGDVGTTHGDSAAYAWNAGLGFIMENMRIDATFTNDFITSGPHFISGVDRSAPMFYLLSATGKF